MAVSFLPGNAMDKIKDTESSESKIYEFNFII